MKKKIKIEIAYDSEIPLLTYPEKMIIEKDTHPDVDCSTADKSQKAWDGPKGPSTGEWEEVENLQIWK